MAVGVLGQGGAALSASRVSQGSGLGWPTGVDGGTDDHLGNMSAGRGAALDGVHEVVEHLNPVTGHGLEEGRGDTLAGGPLPRFWQRLARGAAVLGAGQVLLLDLPKHGPGDGGG